MEPSCRSYISFTTIMNYANTAAQEGPGNSSNSSDDDDDDRKPAAQEETTTEEKGTSANPPPCRKRKRQTNDSPASSTAAAARVSESKSKNTHQRRWEEMYNRLVVFYRTHGHSNVPNRFVEDPQLGSWGAYLVLSYRSMCMSIGLEWCLALYRACVLRSCLLFELLLGGFSFWDAAVVVAA